MPRCTLEDADTIAIVGNAPEIGHEAARIDACDAVVRFNMAPGLGGRAGRRVTHLALVNRGGQPREWLENGFAGVSALAAATEVILPFPQIVDGPDGLCWTREMTMALGPFRVRSRTLDDDLHRRARDELRLCGATGGVRPSTGFLVAYDLWSRYGAQKRFSIFGFGFAGWHGHPWEAERRWFEERRREGSLELHPLASA